MKQYAWNRVVLDKRDPQNIRVAKDDILIKHDEFWDGKSIMWSIINENRLITQPFVEDLFSTNSKSSTNAELK